MLCWHLPSSGSWLLISLWLPGRGRKAALEWGALTRASIFNELDIYFSPSWLPPDRSLCLLPLPCQQLQGSGEQQDKQWDPRATPNPAPGEEVTLTWARVRWEWGKGSLVPSSGVTAVLTIPWGRDQTEGQLDGSTLSLETGSCPSALQI